MIYSGEIASPQATFSVVQWHAHKMFCGFGWAVLGEFMLAATKNWVQVRGYYGYALMFLVAAWLFERIIAPLLYSAMNRWQGTLG